MLNRLSPAAAAAWRACAAAGAGALRLLRLPAEATAYAAAYAVGKWHAIAASHAMAAAASPPVLDPAATAALAAAWRKLERTPPQQPGPTGSAANQPLPAGAWDTEAAASPLGAPQAAKPGGEALPGLGSDSAGVAGGCWSAAEQALIGRIREETAWMNRNNVTRTAAYYAVYVRRPELHWALLAHLVSRNGGWNMTDLQAEWVPRLLGTSKREDVFAFLERANSLIFGDAYPQLLLYEHSMKHGRPLFHLLPAFGVSRFMAPAWERFWASRESALLTVALIVNEQHFIEDRVVRHPHYRKRVIDTLFFGMQSFLQLNAVVIPYSISNGDGDSGETPSDMRLAGLIIERFASIRERIEFGKRLYAILFGVPTVHEGVRAFVREVRHTGSRADFAPQLFSRIRHGLPERPYNARLQGGKLKPGAERPYSPTLAAAWPERPVAPPEPGDWFVRAADVLLYFERLPLPGTFELTNEYGFLLDKLELAAEASHRVDGPEGLDAVSAMPTSTAD
ncbi:Protein of unknown function DUF2515 [Paenibacillus curdlanolyticus YK9]|uniref:DUF2515 domain-containing protein n=1 Tax=Paenibacillus curdlanolyticus YK9 TaxID=717606 RepID=E0I3V5_9BACL|nr:DUF2515 domain-containing protein [Paenibacillus curdlanolyticus]EFM12969.1 Protein of unknown function DUF2515 [Paenibacillus curdlanolyticus YK9]